MREYREFVTQQQHARGVRIAVFGITVLVLSVCAVVVARTLLLPTPELTPTTVLPDAVTPTTATMPAPMATDAPVLTNTLPPTGTPIPTETPVPAPTPIGAPSAGFSPTLPSDPQGDVGVYESGDPVEGVPNGVDIRTASVGADLRVALWPTEGVSAELAGLATEDEVLLWISFYEPIPDPPAMFTDWVFVLDLDGDVTTGRPVGTVRINPDLGYEVAVGVSYNSASGEYEPYFLVWDPAGSTLVLQPDVPRFTLNEARTLIGLALPLETLTETVKQTAGVTLVTGEVRGRAAAQSYAGERQVVDFYPDRPD